MLALASCFIRIFSHETTSQSDTLRKDALNVFMQAGDYIKKHITFINYVRDIKVTDLYIIETYQVTGSGGGAFTFFLVGQNRYSGMCDTAIVNTSPDDTDDAIRLIL